MAKKIAIAVWLVTALLLGILVLNYYGNRKLIERYGAGVYQQNELGFLGFTQPYINHFNRGNVYFQLGDYQKAKQEYQSALNVKPGDPYDCKIRVNYALSYVKPIDIKKINKDNYKETIEICETAKSILSEKDCATPNNDGHYYAAQKLYNEINNFIEELKNQYENPDPTPTPTPSPTPTPDPEGGTPTPTPTSKPDGDATETPSPSPTPTPSDNGLPTPSATPTPTPGGETSPTPSISSTPTPTLGGETPTPTPGGDQNTPTPTGVGETGTPTPTPGGDQGTPTPTPSGEGTGTPTPTPGGEGTGTPTPTPGDGDGGDGGDKPLDGQPEPTKSPADRIRDIQNRGNQERTGGGGGKDTGKNEYNYGDSATW